VCVQSLVHAPDFPYELAPFEDVYDARTVFTDKAKMVGYNTRSLKFNNVVVLKMSVSQYRIKEDEGNSSKRAKPSQAWARFKATYQLEAVLILHSAPYIKRTTSPTKASGVEI
jgi:hypothetical protein